MKQKLTAMRMGSRNHLRKAGGIACVLYAALVFCASPSSFAQTGDTRTVVATLLLSDAQTMTKGNAQGNQDLVVAASGAKNFDESKSWLYFNASALPSDISDESIQLQLTLKTGEDRGMAITVVAAKAGPNPSQPQSYTPSADRSQGYAGVSVLERSEEAGYNRFRYLETRKPCSRDFSIYRSSSAGSTQCEPSRILRLGQQRRSGTSAPPHRHLQT